MTYKLNLKQNMILFNYKNLYSNKFQVYFDIVKIIFFTLLLYFFLISIIYYKYQVFERINDENIEAITFNRTILIYKEFKIILY